MPHEKYREYKCWICLLYRHIKWSCPWYVCPQCKTNCGHRQENCITPQRNFDRAIMMANTPKLTPEPQDSPSYLDKPPRANQQHNRRSTPYDKPSDQSDGHYNNPFHGHQNLQTVHSRLWSTSPSHSGLQSEPSNADTVRVRPQWTELQASSSIGTHAIHSRTNDYHRSYIPPPTYFHGPTNEEVSQYDLYRYITCCTSRQDDADDLHDSLNESTLWFVAGMSDDELVDMTNQYFDILDPPAVFNPYYLAALHWELTNHQCSKGTCWSSPWKFHCAALVAFLPLLSAYTETYFFFYEISFLLSLFVIPCPL